MSQFDEIKKIMHNKYVRNKILPRVIEHIKNKQKVMSNKEYILCSILKKKFLPTPINMSSSEVSMIPGIFRCRLKLNSSNLEKPIEPKVHNQNYNHQNYNHQNYNHNNDNDFKMAIQNSLNDINYSKDNEDYDFQMAIKQSISDFNNFDDFNNLETEDLDIQMIIEQSFNNQTDNQMDVITNNQTSNQIDNEMNVDELINETMEDIMDDIIMGDSFFVCIDLRIYGPNPSLPICVDNKLYYFNHNQINVIKKEWNKVNPDTISGQNFKHELEFFHNMAVDYKTMNIN